MAVYWRVSIPVRIERGTASTGGVEAYRKHIEVLVEGDTPDDVAFILTRALVRSLNEVELEDANARGEP